MRNHFIIMKDSGIPLIGVQVFGIIDRGTNLLQVRPVSGCPLNCVYCSVDEGLSSKKSNTYEVELNYLLDFFDKVAEYKKVDDVEAHIDGIGEPLLYKDIIGLVKGLKNNPYVKIVSMQTNGVLLSEELVKDLARAGLGRINLSLNTLDECLAKELSGLDSYDVKKIMRIAECIVACGIDLLIAPVLIPSFNDDSMKSLVLFAEKLNAKIGIQKFEKQKHGRRLKVKEESWYYFNKRLEKLGKELDYKLLLNRDDFNIHKCKSLPVIFSKGDKVSGAVVLPGWLNNESIIKVKDKLVTVFNSNNKIGDLVKARIVKNKHNIYLAEKLTR